MKSLKKIGMISICLLMTLFMAVGCGKKEENNGGNNNNGQENEPVVNQNAGVIGEKEVEGFKFENISLVTEKGATTFINYMTNTNDEAVEVSQVKVTMKNANDEVVTGIDINILREVAANETIQLSASFDMDLTNVDAIEYEIIK